MRLSKDVHWENTSAFDQNGDPLSFSVNVSILDDVFIKSRNQCLMTRFLSKSQEASRAFMTLSSPLSN